MGHKHTDTCEHCARLEPVKRAVLDVMKGHGLMVIDIHIILQQITVQLLISCGFESDEDRLAFFKELTNSTREVLDAEIALGNTKIVERVLQ